MHRITWSVVLLAAIVTAPLDAQEGKASGIALGQVAPNLVFTDIRYLPRTLDDYRQGQPLVVLISGRSCPIVARYLPRLVRWSKEPELKGVKWLALDPVAGETITDIAAQALEYDVPFAFGRDFDRSAARTLGATRLGQVMVLDKDRRLVYRGRVDSQYRLGGVRPSAGRADLKEALLDVLAGREVRVKETPVDGCLLQLDIAEPEPRQVTFHEDVEPIFQRSCQSCHRPHGDAPFPLVSYEDARRSGAMLGEVVMQRRMPPWYANPAHGSFANAPDMSDADRETIRDWVRRGLPRGDPKAAPPRLKWPAASAWEIGEPDLIIEARKPFEIPAEGYFPYQYTILPHLFERDTWIQGVEIRASTPEVLHHANLFWKPRVGSFTTEGWMTGKVPGGRALDLDRGTAIRIPADSVLILQIHYVPTGKKEQDRPSVALKFAKGRVERRLRHLTITEYIFKVPPHAPFHAVSAEETLDRDIRALWITPHMHLRGRDMSFTAKHPDGTEEILLQVPNYSFDWQASYLFRDGGRILPKGTTVRVDAHYDNSAFNPYNPDPTKTVRFGADAIHEMMYGFVFYVDPKEALALEVDPKSGRAR